jgi:hypothetical protein
VGSHWGNACIQKMTKSFLLILLFSAAALRCRLLKHQLTTTKATIEGPPIATPNPMAKDLLAPEVLLLWESIRVGTCESLLAHKDARFRYRDPVGCQ